MVKLDPEKVRLASVLSKDDVMGVERVDAMAARRGALVAINGGFFNIKNGEPIGLLKVAGELVSDTDVQKGVVAIRAPAAGRTELEFDQVAVRVVMSFRAGGRDWSVPVDGVDTTRERGKLMLYTPSYFMDSDTAPGGVEWMLIPASTTDTFRVLDIRHDAGHTPIPARGGVLSFGGLELPEALAALAPKTDVTLSASVDHRARRPARTARDGGSRRQRRRIAEARRPHARQLADAREAQPAELHRHAPSAHGHRHRCARLHLVSRHRRPPSRIQRRHDVARSSCGCASASASATRSTSTAADRRRSS